MKRLLTTGILAIASAGCVSGPETGQPQQVEVVAIEWWVWGVNADDWSVSRYGPVTHKTADRVAPATFTTKIRTFTISAKDFDTVVAILKPAPEKAGADVPCDKPMMTDQPSLTIKWALRDSEYALHVNYGCVSAAMESVKQSYAKAMAFLRDLEAKAPS